MRARSIAQGAWGQMMLAVVLMTCGAFGQTASDLGEGLRAELTTTSGVTAIKWWGKAGRTYFVQSSETLLPDSWQYMPVVEAGADGVCTWNLQTSASKMFVRLVYSDEVFSGSAASADFDGDGLPNDLEVSIGFGTNPFVADSDGDGYQDGDEHANGSDPASSASQPASGGSPEQLPDEPYVYLASHRKTVYNQWGKSAPNSVPAWENGTLSWFDYGDPPFSEGYEEFIPRWSGKWSTLKFPEQVAGAAPEAADAGFSSTSGYVHAYARHWLGSNPNGTTSGTVTLASHRPALVFSSAWETVSWTLSRRVLSFNAAGENNVVSSFSEVTFKEVKIPPDRRSTPLADRMALALEVTEQTDKHAVLVEPLFYFSGGQHLAFDHLTHGPNGPQRWLMLPQGEERQVQLASSTPVGRVVYQAQGGGVQPATRVPTQGGSSTISFSSSTLGTSGYLKMGLARDLNAASPSFFPEGDSSDPDNLQCAARFVVLPPKLLTVYVHRIKRGSTPLAQQPDAATLKTFLDGIFKVQANIEVNVQIMDEKNVAFDVGLGLPNGTGTDDTINNNYLDILVGKPPRQNQRSAEESAIIAASPIQGDGVNVYLVASQGVLTVHEWSAGTNPINENRDDLVSRPYRGWASGALRLDTPNIAWVASDTDSDPDVNKEYWMIAHEIGHVLGLGHTQDPRKIEKTTFTEVEYPGFVRNSDSESRLMTGRFGPKSRSSPKRMVKGDWVEIHKSTLLKAP